jgi:NAD(P)-dependent dehydrogenase (short-subunit alcohol dehydrogenase family)
MDDLLAGKVALVTGGASGIGAACAQTLAERGALVMIADVDAARAQQQAAAIVAAGGKASATRADVADPVSVEAMVKHTLEMFGRLNLAVNNAGVAPQPVPLHRIALDDWRRMIDINLSGLFYCMRHEIPAMLATRGGAIVNMASVLGTVGGKGTAGYVAAKHGVIGLTKAAALDYAAKGIRVNAVCPGFIDSPLIREEAGWELMEAYLTALHPVGRLGKESEVAEMVAFLLSDRAAFITGGSYLVDGGYTAQ